MLVKYLLVYGAAFLGIFTAVFFLLTLFENRKKLKNPKPLPELPGVSVVIPAYNEEKSLEKTVKSVQSLDYPAELVEIIIVDDGSKDSTLKIAKKLRMEDSRIKVFTKQNGGRASAKNHGIKHAKFPLIATLDSDSFIEKDALRKMIGYFGDSKVASVTAALKVHNPKSYWQRIQHIEYLFSIFLRKVFAFINAIHVTPGPFSLYRKKFFDRHGLFDETKLAEDTEIALRIQRHNYRIENSIDAVVETVSPRKFSELLRQRIRWYYGLIQSLQSHPQLFMPKYGYVALFALPAAIISVLVILVLVIYFTKLNLLILLDTVRNWHLIGFDFLNLVKGFKLSYLYYELTSPISFFLLISVLLNLLLVFIAKVKSGEKRSIKLSYCYYFAAYCYLYSIWWIAAFIYMLFGKLSWTEFK